jgi:hypothetical protein
MDLCVIIGRHTNLRKTYMQRRSVAQNKGTAKWIMSDNVCNAVNAAKFCGCNEGLLKNIIP